MGRTGCSRIGWLATGWPTPVVKLGITSSLNGGVMFHASLHTDDIFFLDPGSVYIQSFGYD